MSRLLATSKVNVLIYDAMYLLSAGNKPYSAIPASLRWTAPEILRHPTADESNRDVFTASCDVYSYGMVLWEIVTSAIPFYNILDEKEVCFTRCISN